MTAMIATVLDRYPTPPCAKLLGLKIIGVDRVTRSVRVRFEARPEFCNPAGHVQGGLLTAMLDDSMGPAVLIETDAAVYPVTISLNVTFLAPARPGPIFATATIRQLGKTIGCVEASLEDERGVELARATSNVRLLPMRLEPLADTPACDGERAWAWTPGCTGGIWEHQPV
jgi:uncharacterized protein (TIGR00369 family)